MFKLAWIVFALVALVVISGEAPAYAGEAGHPVNRGPVDREPVNREPVNRRPIHQLRIYEIFDDNKQAFHDRFRDHAARIMARYDFPIVAMWESRLEGRTEFVYLLEWSDEQTMKQQWAKFMADEEWSAIKRETGAVHGRLVGDIEDRILKATQYSPTSRLLQ